MKLSPEKNLVLLLSQPFPSEEALQTAANLFTKIGRRIDLAALDRLLNLCQTAPLFYRNAVDTTWENSEMLEKYKRIYFTGLSFSEGHVRETLAVLARLGNSGINAIPLKGPIAAELLLGDPALYRSSDIDLLVKPEDIDKTLAVLDAGGYRRTSSIDIKDELKGSYHITVSKDIFHLELHWNLVMRYFSADPDYWWKDVKEIEYRGQKIFQLSHEKLLLYLVFRLFSKGFLPLKYFIFPLGLVSRHDVVFDWNKFMRYSRELKMERLANFTANLLHDIFFAEIPETVRDKKIAGYSIIKSKVIAAFFTARINSHLRMIMLLILLDSPIDIFKVLIRRIIPPMAELRLRYNIPRGSVKILPYYLLNPLIMLFRKTERP